MQHSATVNKTDRRSRRRIRTGLALVAALSAGLYASIASATPLRFDVNDRTDVNNQAGWTPVDLNGASGVSLAAVGGVFLDDRDRDNANTNGGDAANNGMWRDFVFADQRGQTIPDLSAAGIDITISGLIASMVYQVDLWAFDELSNGGRNMTWNGNALNIPDGPDPASLTDQAVTFSAVADASGVLLLEGRIAANPGPCCNVFVNGFQLTALGSVAGTTAVVPEPSALAVFGLGLAAFGIAARRRRRF